MTACLFTQLRSNRNQSLALLGRNPTGPSGRVETSSSPFMT